MHIDESDVDQSNDPDQCKVTEKAIELEHAHTFAASPKKTKAIKTERVLPLLRPCDSETIQF